MRNFPTVRCHRWSTVDGLKAIGSTRKQWVLPFQWCQAVSWTEIWWQRHELAGGIVTNIYLAWHSSLATPFFWDQKRWNLFCLLEAVTSVQALLAIRNNNGLQSPARNVRTICSLPLILWPRRQSLWTMYLLQSEEFMLGSGFFSLCSQPCSSLSVSCPRPWHLGSSLVDSRSRPGWVRQFCSASWQQLEQNRDSQEWVRD